MEGETVGSSVRGTRKTASKAVRIALGVFVTCTIVLGIALFLGKLKVIG